MKPTRSTAQRLNGSTASPGFTILELLVVLAIIGFFAIALSSRLAGVSEQAGVTTALEEMNNIKSAIVDLFYPDLGFIPEDPGPNGKLVSAANVTAGDDDRPWFATRYLCLRDDRDRTSGTPDPSKAHQSYAMWSYLRSQIDRKNPASGSAKSTALAKLTWDRYRQKGWRGPYMEQDAMAMLGASEPTAMPLIATPWADKCEKLALQAEEAGEESEAEQFRRGKYYLIVTDTVVNADRTYSADKESARVISFGADCEDSGSFRSAGAFGRAEAKDLRRTDYDTGDDIVVFIFGGGTTRRPTE
jgi:prepilin-type N-terminal cleavage/methylation domain-containing protein